MSIMASATVPPPYPATDDDDDGDEPRRRDVERLLAADALPMSDRLRDEARSAGERLFAAGKHAPLRPGDRLGPYRIARLLGLGGQAFVFEAVHEALGRRVALKVPRAEVAERVLHEARLAASLEHPHVVRVEDVGAAETGDGREVPYLVMELCPGGSLEQLLERYPRGLPLPEVRRIAGAVLEALAWAHDRGVVHRDVKPANVLFDAQGTPKLSDLGIGTLATGAADLVHSVSLSRGVDDGPAGTPLYVAPEQEDPRRVAGSAVDGRADLFSFGKMLFVLLTGASPRTIRPASRLRPGLAAAWDDLIFRLVEEDRGRRPAAARDVLAALRALPDAEVRPATGPTPATPGPAAPSVPVGLPVVVRPAAREGGDDAGGPARRRRSRAARLFKVAALGSCAYAAWLELNHPTLGLGLAWPSLLPVKAGALLAGLLLAWFAGLERRAARPTAFPVAALLVALLAGWAPWSMAHARELSAGHGFVFTTTVALGLAALLGLAARVSLFRRARVVVAPPPAPPEVRVRPRALEVLPEVPPPAPPRSAGGEVVRAVLGVFGAAVAIAGVVALAVVVGIVLVALAALG